MYSPVAVEHNDIETIRKDLIRIAVDCGPCDIVLADVENATPIERVGEFLKIAESIT